MDYEIISLKDTKHQYFKEQDYVHLLSNEHRGLSQEVKDIIHNKVLINYEFKVRHGMCGNSSAWNMIKNLRVKINDKINDSKNIKTYIKINDIMYEFNGSIFTEPFPLAAVTWDKVSLVVKSDVPTTVTVLYDRIYTPQSMGHKIMQTPKHVIKFTDSSNIIVSFGSCKVVAT